MVGFDWNFGACQNFSYGDVKFPSNAKHVIFRFQHVAIQKHVSILVHVMYPTCQVQHLHRTCMIRRVPFGQARH